MGEVKEEPNKLSTKTPATKKPDESQDIKNAKDRDPLAGLERQIKTGLDEADIDDFFEYIGQNRTFRREIAAFGGREIELQVLSNKQMKRIFRASRNKDGERDEIEFNYLLAWEAWIPTNRGIMREGKFLPILSYEVFCQIPWQIINEIALQALAWSMGGFDEDDIKKNASESQNKNDGS